MFAGRAFSSVFCLLFSVFYIYLYSLTSASSSEAGRRRKRLVAIAAPFQKADFEAAGFQLVAQKGARRRPASSRPRSRRGLKSSPSSSFCPTRRLIRRASRIPTVHADRAFWSASSRERSGIRFAERFHHAVFGFLRSGDGCRALATAGIRRHNSGCKRCHFPAFGPFPRTERESRTGRPKNRSPYACFSDGLSENPTRRCNVTSSGLRSKPS